MGINVVEPVQSLVGFITKEDFSKLSGVSLYNISAKIDKKEFYICCDICGKKARKKSKWVCKNRSFRAQFRCSKCKRDFEGRLTFRLKYEGLTIDRRVVVKDDVPKEQKRKKLREILACNCSNKKE